MSKYFFEFLDRYYEIEAADYTEATMKLIQILKKRNTIEIYQEGDFKCKISDKIYNLRVNNYFDALKQIYYILKRENILQTVTKKTNLQQNYLENKVEIIEDKIYAKTISKKDNQIYENNEDRIYARPILNKNRQIYENNEEKTEAEEKYTKYFGNSELAIKKLKELVKDEELEKELENE